MPLHEEKTSADRPQKGTRLLARNKVLALWAESGITEKDCGKEGDQQSNDASAGRKGRATHEQHLEECLAHIVTPRRKYPRKDIVFCCPRHRQFGGSHTQKCKIPFRCTIEPAAAARRCVRIPASGAIMRRGICEGSCWALRSDKAGSAGEKEPWLAADVQGQQMFLARDQ